MRNSFSPLESRLLPLRPFKTCAPKRTALQLPEPGSLGDAAQSVQISVMIYRRYSAEYLKPRTQITYTTDFQKMMCMLPGLQAGPVIRRHLWKPLGKLCNPGPQAVGARTSELLQTKGRAGPDLDRPSLSRCTGPAKSSLPYTKEDEAK